METMNAGINKHNPPKTQHIVLDDAMTPNNTPDNNTIQSPTQSEQEGALTPSRETKTSADSCR